MDSTLVLKPELRQKITLSQQQRQGLEILQLPLLDLEQYLSNAMLNNPVLEEQLPDEPVADLPAEPPIEHDTSDEALYDAEAVNHAEEWQEELALPQNSSFATAPATPAEELLRYTAAPGPDFRDQLAVELNSTRHTERQLQLAQAVIDALDDRGFLPVPAADLAMANNAELPEVEDAIELVQSLDPPGIGARNLPECWRLQLRRMSTPEPLLEKILTEGVADLTANRWPKLAAHLGISLEELGVELAKLKKLAVYPEISAPDPDNSYIRPDAEILPEGDNFKVHVFAEPRQLHLSARYLKMLEDPQLPPDTRSYLEEKFKAARELFNFLALRKSTLLRLTELLVEIQDAFLRSGVTGLKPYTMKEAASRLELSESTISRTVADKYVATPQGIFPYRYFFTAGYLTSEGEVVSNRAVMAKIQELIAAEDPHHPVSDEKLATSLREAGFEVARRTVAKYREQLNIPGSSLRKKHI